MKTSQAILTAVLTVCLSGCVIGSKPKVTTPPAPQPAPAPPPPAPPPQPLSLPQTQVQLPPEQVPDPAAFEVPETTAAQPATSPPTHPSKPKPKPTPPPATVAEPPAPPAAAADAQPTEVRGPAHEVLSAAETNRLKNNADKLKRDMSAWLASSKGQKLDPNDPIVARIRSLMHASDQAEEKGDMREASDLAEHAMGFLRELQSGR